MLIHVFVLLTTMWLQGANDTQKGVVIQPMAFQTLADCDKVRTELEDKVKVSGIKFLGFRSQCVDNSMKLVGENNA